MGQTTMEEAGEEIRKTLSNGLQKGYHLVFHMGCGNNFNLIEFLKQFSFYSDGLLTPSKNHDKKFLVSSGVVKTEEDKDHFGNQGYYEVVESSKIMILSTCKEEEIDDMLKNNSDLSCNTFIVN